FSPIGYADRSVWHAGLYFPRLPHLSRIDLRVEGIYTDNPLGGKLCCGFFYSNLTWRSGYVNGGNLIGSWIGRDSQGAQGWINYWFSSQTRIQLNYRHQKVSQQFVPGGGTLTDVGARSDFWVGPSLSVSSSVQWEQWLFPVIQPNPSRNVSLSLEVL